MAYRDQDIDDALSIGWITEEEHRQKYEEREQQRRLKALHGPIDLHAIKRRIAQARETDLQVLEGGVGIIDFEGQDEARMDRLEARRRLWDEDAPRLVREVEVLEKAAVTALEVSGRPFVLELAPEGSVDRLLMVERVRAIMAKPPAPGSCVVVPDRDTVAYHRAVCFSTMTKGTFLATEGGQRFFAFMPGSYLVEFGPGTRWCVQFGEHTAYGTRVPNRWLAELEATMRRHPGPKQEEA